jgi:hypothetical protein
MQFCIKYLKLLFMRKIVLSIYCVSAMLIAGRLSAQLSFKSPTQYGVGSNPILITSADFNGDGIPDLAVVNLGSNDVSILLNSSTGTFAPAVNYPVGSGPVSITSADFNGDGKVDLAVTNQNSGNVSILLGSGTGTFAPAVNYVAGLVPYEVTSADFNGDGKVDLAVTDIISNNVSLLLGSGTGTFAPAVNYAVGTNPFGVTSADFNGDSKVDLAVVNQNSSNVSILLGTGTGAFATAVNYAVGYGPGLITADDFDGDGTTDLAITNYNDISILLGSGTGTFAAAVNYTVGTNPYGVTSADFNVDGKADLAVVNAGSNNVSVLLSGIFLPAEALSFDGVNIINMPAAASLTNLAPSGFSMESWVFPRSASGAQSIIRKSGDYNLYINGGYLVAEVWTSGTSSSVFQEISALSPFPLNTWSHVAFTWDGTTGVFYINGVLIASSVSNNNIATSENLSLGASSLYGNYLDGVLDEVRIWNVVRSQCEINTFKSCEIPTSASGLIANYHFNQGLDSAPNATVTSLIDASGNANTGTLINFALTGITSNWIAPGAIVSGYTTTVNLTPTVNSTVTNSVICSGALTTLSGTGASTYVWTEGVIDGTPFSPTTTATYTVIGMATNGCTNTAISTVSVNALPLIFINASNSNICFGSSITLTAGGTTTYTWANGVTDGLAFTPTTSATYSVSTADAVTGCENTATKFITVNTLPIVTVNSGVICSGQSFTMTPGGASTYTYSSGSAVVSPTANLTYSVTGTSAQGCVSSNTAVASITVNNCPLAEALSFDGINDRISVPVAAALNNLAPTGFSMESWVYPRSGSGAHSIIRKSGDYNLYINGGKLAAEVWTSGTSNSSFKIFSASTALTLNTWSHVAFTWDGITGKLYINGVVVASSITNNNIVTSENLNLGASSIYGNYLNGVLDEVRIWNKVRTQCEINTYKGCEIPTSSTGLIANYHFNQGYGSAPNTTVNNLTDASGNSNTGSLNNFALTGSTSNWITPGGVAAGYTTAAITTPTVSSTATNYVICLGNSTVLNGTGASSYTWTNGVTNGISFSPSTTLTYTVTGTAANGCTNTAVNTITVNTLPIVTVNSGTICSGQSFTMIPSGASTYTYSSGSAIVLPTTNATYNVTGTSSQGCVSSNTAVASVTVNTTPTVTVNSGTICSGQSFTMIPSGASTYTYSSGSAIVSPTTNATYNVTGTAANGCKNTAVNTITVNTLPIVSVNSGVICTGQSFTMIPSGASTYTYSSGSAVVSPTTNANYSVTGTDANGCLSTIAALSSVTVNAIPTVSVNSGVICAGQSFTMTPSGASTYTYSSGSAVVSPTATVNYSVTGTDANGCLSTIAALSSVTVNAIPTVSVNSGVICAGQSFTMTPSGASTYTYSSGSAVVSPTATVNYSVTGTDANGCLSTIAALSSVTVNAIPTVSVNSGVICAGQSFTILPSGASTYTYSSGSAVVSPTTNASYSVTGTDVNGCASSVAAESSVTVNALPTIAVNSGAICASQSFTMVPTGAVTYSYASGTNVVSPLSDATYSVSGTDANGCVSSVDAVSSVTVNALPIVSVNSGTICLGQSFTITPSGASTYTYSSGSAVVSPTTNANYSVTGTDANGCVSATGTVSSLTVNALPTVMAMTSNTFLCSGQTANLIASGASSYTWNTTASTTVVAISPSVTTTYTVTGINVNGCSNLATITQSVSTCTGIDNLPSNISNASFLIYPNPTSGILNVELEMINEEHTTIEITNALGQVVLSEIATTKNLTLKTNNLNNGIYVVKVITDSSQTTKRLVVSK